MAFVERHSQEIPSSDYIQKASDDPISKMESTPEKQNKAAHSQNQGSSQTQSAGAGNEPLTHKQVLEIKQPTAQFIINSSLQAAAFAVAIAFGIFAVKSVQVGNTANSYANQAAGQALTANQLTLLTFCFAMNSSQVSDFNSICSRVTEAAESMIFSAATALFTNLPSPTTTPTLATTTTVLPFHTSSNLGSGPKNTGSNKSGIIVGVIIGPIIIIGAVLFFCLRPRRSRSRANSAPAGCTNPHYPTATMGANFPTLESPQYLLQRKSFGKWFRENFMDTKVVARTE